MAPNHIVAANLFVAREIAAARHIRRMLAAGVVCGVVSGCVAGNNVSHADDPGAARRDAGPVLCRDGTPPPCVPRD